MIDDTGDAKLINLKIEWSKNFSNPLLNTIQNISKFYFVQKSFKSSFYKKIRGMSFFLFI